MNVRVAEGGNRTNAARHAGRAVGSFAGAAWFIALGLVLHEFIGVLGYVSIAFGLVMTVSGIVHLGDALGEMED